MFLKTGLKNESLKIVPLDFAKHTFLESALHRLSLGLSWMKLCKRGLVFKFLTFMIKFIAFQFLLQAVDVN